MIHTRTYRRDDEAFLWEMLYQSLHVRDGEAPFPRSVLDQPDIAHYLIGFGRTGDDAQLAFDAAGQPIGAAWCRCLPADDPGYGFVAADVPELGMAVVADRRGEGIGRRLLQELLERNPTMSLSVDQQNPSAVALYRSFGFVAVGSDATSFTMLRRAPESNTDTNER